MLRRRTVNLGGLLVSVGISLACGRTLHRTPPTSSGGDGAASSAQGGTGGVQGGTGGAQGGTGGAQGGTGGGSGGRAAGGMGGAGARAASRGGAAGASPVAASCVQFQGFPVDPVLGATLDGVNLATKFKAGCDFDLGSRVPLPVGAEHGRLVLHYDLNGDQIDDLFFGEPLVVASSRSLKLLMSDPYSRELKFAEVECEIPLDVSYTKIFARDLDGDLSIDWIVGTPTGVKVLMNRPDGLREVGSHDFGAGVNALALQDVAAAAFDDAKSKQIVVGYDLYRSDQVETGVLLFVGSGSGDALTYDARVLSSTVVPSDGPGVESGYVTPVSVGERSAIFGLGLDGPYPSGWLWDGADNAAIDFPDAGFGAVNLARSAVLGENPALAIGFAQNILFYELANAASAPMPAGALETYFETGLGHELGGGQRIHTRFLRDLDWDGDSDLIELDRQSSGTGAIVISMQESPDAFTQHEPIELDSNVVPTGYEDPFLPVGGAEGRVLVRDAEPESEDGGTVPPALQSLVCK